MREILDGSSACLLYFNKYNALRQSRRARLWCFARALQGLAKLRIRRGPKGASRKTPPKDRRHCCGGRAALSLITKVFATHPFAKIATQPCQRSLENVKLQTNISSEFFVTPCVKSSSTSRQPGSTRWAATPRQSLPCRRRLRFDPASSPRPSARGTVMITGPSPSSTL
jgi:hypothetical protein